MKRLIPWLMLILGGLIEIGLFISLKFSQGFTQLYPTVLVILFATLGYFLLQRAKKSIPPVVAYSVYFCIGSVGVVYLGIGLFAEIPSWSTLFFLWLLFIGITGFYASKLEAVNNEGDSEWNG